MFLFILTIQLMIIHKYRDRGAMKLETMYYSVHTNSMCRLHSNQYTRVKSKQYIYDGI